MRLAVWGSRGVSGDDRTGSARPDAGAEPRRPSVTAGPVARHRERGGALRRQPLMTLCTFAFMGGFNPTSSSLRIGMSTGPNASKSACDSQMSKT